MCLITNDKTLYTATEDMTVYKCLHRIDDNTAKAVYQYHYYKLGELYITEIEESNDWCAYDTKDINWLDGYCSIEKDWRRGNVKSLMCIGPGFHAATKKERLCTTSWNEDYLYKCTIPKDAQYYLGPTDLIVSNKIIIVEIID